MEPKKLPATTIKESPAGEFDTVLFRASGDNKHLFSNLTHDEVAEVLSGVNALIDHQFPSQQDYTGVDGARAFVMRCKNLNEAGCHSAEVCHTVLSGLSELSFTVVKFMSEKYEDVRRLLFSESERDQERAEVVDVNVQAIASESDPHDVELMEQLLQTQEECLVKEREKQNPAQAVRGGLLSRMSREEVFDALRAPEAQILIIKNASVPFGFTIYHGTGSCAGEDKEFVQRAHQALVTEYAQQKIEHIFGERYSPAQVATVYTALIDPTICDKFEQGGADTPRSAAYDAMVYFLLHELATSEKRPEWVLAWVRTWPNPNLAIRAHESVLFRSTEVELPFNTEEPDGLRLMLIVTKLDTIFDRDGKPKLDLIADPKSDADRHTNLLRTQLKRMKDSTERVPLSDYDVAS